MSRLLLILLIVSSGTLSAQKASLILRGPEQPLLNLFLDGELTDSIPTAALVIDSLDLGQHTLDVQLVDSVGTFIRASLFAYPQITYHVTLEETEEGWKLSQRESLANEETAAAPQQERAEVDARPMEANVFLTAQRECALPITPQELQAIKSQLKEVYFERERAQLLADIFESSCYTVDQIKEMISLIDNESRRLDLIKQAYTNCFDRSRYNELDNMFLLEMYATEFQGWLNAKK